MFEQAVNLSLEREGVLSDHKNDKGGLTKYGISKVHHPEVDVKNLTKEGAIKIYRAKYWDECGCDQLPWWAALLTFDAAVNHGPGRAKRWLQEAVGASVDGDIGPKTIAAVRACHPEKGIEELMTIRMLSYVSDSTWETFKRGWTRRAFGMALAAHRPF